MQLQRKQPSLLFLEKKPPQHPATDFFSEFLGFISQMSVDLVQAYMKHIQENAEASVRSMLQVFSLGQGLPNIGTVHGEDQMDDGTPIKLAVTIDRTKGTASFDFSGTGASHSMCSFQMYQTTRIVCLQAPNHQYESGTYWCLISDMPHIELFRQC